ncbi:hypothetical protein Bpfe_014225, partial [Biomphalaria pfeifferi]
YGNGGGLNSTATGAGKLSQAIVLASLTYVNSDLGILIVFFVSHLRHTGAMSQVISLPFLAHEQNYVRCSNVPQGSENPRDLLTFSRPAKR